MITRRSFHPSTGRPEQNLTRIAMAQNHAGPVLVSFDVDGTLIHSVGVHANKLHKAAFTAGFKEVFETDTHIDVIQHHGGTDPLIVIQVMAHHGVSKEEAMLKLAQCQDTMNQHYLTHASEAAEGLQILPGVRALLERLQAHQPRVSTCLVTGNLEPIGLGKMKALGIEPLFSQPWFGGFGSDVCSGNTDETWRDRAEMVRIAAKKGQATVAGAAEGWGARFHVGDTPMDVLAALDAGAVAIGVATGIYSAEQLRACCPPGSEGRLVILSNLEDTDAVMRALGLGL